MKYMLFYTEGCSPKIRYFGTHQEAKIWAGQFLLRNSRNTDDNWIDMIIRGRVKSRYSDWAMRIKAEPAKTSFSILNLKSNNPRPNRSTK